MIGMGTQRHPSNSWDEAREGVPRSSRKRRTERNSNAIVRSEFSHRRNAELTRVELHPEFDGWREIPGSGFIRSSMDGAKPTLLTSERSFCSLRTIVLSSEAW